MTSINVDPAYAGMILSGYSTARIWPSGPRVCGDDPVLSVNVELVYRWTPRMRG